ncbi:MAG: SpoIIE family protein phosphatase [Parachlamydiales bacterium]|nr:SpoIIE family protein phosphatase [Parachlamydiales bacterium]
MFIVSFLVLCLPLILFFAILLRIDYHEDLVHGIEQLQEIAYGRTPMLHHHFTNAQKQLASIAIALNLNHMAPSKDPQNNSQETSELYSSIANEAGFKNIFLMKPNEQNQWKIVASSDSSLINKNMTWNKGWQKVLEYKNFSFGEQKGKTDTPIIYTATTLRDKSNQVVGIFVATLPITTIFDHLLQTQQLGHKVSFSLINDQNILLATSSSKITPNIIQIVTPTASKTTNAQVFYLYPFRNYLNTYEWQYQAEDHFAVILPLEQTDLFLMVSSDKTELILTPRHSLYIFAAICLFIVIFGVMVTLWVTKRLSEPLNQLNRVISDVSQGQYSTRFYSDKRGYEINDVGIGLNHMIEALLKQVETTNTEKLQKETLANQLNIGRSIQLSILPQEMPQLPQVDLAAIALPAQDVGGDFYDLFIKDDINKTLVLSIADAAGKGISACLYSLCLRSMLRSYAMESDDVAAIMQKTNNLFIRDTEQTSMFVTAFSAFYDSQSGLLSFFSCGHPPGLLRRSNGDIVQLGTSAMALGVMDFKTPKEQITIHLEKGDVLLLYTDGITESLNAKNELFGEERLSQFLKEQSNVDSKTIINNLIKAVKDFIKEAPQHDDITLVVMRRL